MQDIKKNIIKKINRETKLFCQKNRMIKGTLYKVQRKRGEKHYEGYQLNYKAKENLTKTLYVKEKNLDKVKNLILNYQQAKKIFNNIIDLNLELLKNED